MDLLLLVLNLLMNSWSMIKVFILMPHKLLGLRIKNKDLNGQKLITLYYYMDGVKKILMEKSLNSGIFKIHGVMIGVKS